MLSKLWFYRWFSAYKSSTADSLLAERGRIDNSHRITDDILALVDPQLYSSSCYLYLQSQAYETRSEFSRQRTNISNMNARMVGVLSEYVYYGLLLKFLKRGL